MTKFLNGCILLFGTSLFIASLQTNFVAIQIFFGVSLASFIISMFVTHSITIESFFLHLGYYTLIGLIFYIAGTFGLVALKAEGII